MEFYFFGGTYFKVTIMRHQPTCQKNGICYFPDMVTGILRRVGCNRIGLANRNEWPSLSFASAWLVLLVLLSTSQPSLSQLTAQYTINFNGNNCVVDSFDSSDPFLSVWQTNLTYNGHNYGTYTNTLRRDNAVVATDGPIVDVGTSKIYGYVDVGPSGIVPINSGGSVGYLSWIGPDPSHPLNTSIQPGHMRDDMNALFPDVALPNPSNWLSIPNHTNYTITVGGQIYTNIAKPGLPMRYVIGGVPYSLIITNRSDQPGTPANKIYYQYPNQLIQSIFIDASNVVLYLPNGIYFGSGDNLTLNGNANVEVYSGSDMRTVNGLVNNLTQYALAFRIFGLPACTRIDFGANTNLATALYAPEASVSFNGGGANLCDVSGIVTAHDINVDGRYNFHLDEFLWNRPPFPPLMITQPQNQAVPVGSDVAFNAAADGGAPEIYRWFLNQTNLLATSTNFTTLSLTNVQLSDAGLYSAIITNISGSATSSPAILFVYTNTAQLVAQMDTPTSDELGNFQFGVTGLTGFHYIVQGSTNLTDWTSLQTKASPFTFTQTNLASWPQRFYRTAFVPTGP